MPAWPPTVVQDPPTTADNDGDVDGKRELEEIEGLKEVKDALVEEESEMVLATPGLSATQTSPCSPSGKPFW